MVKFLVCFYELSHGTNLRSLIPQLLHFHVFVFSLFNVSGIQHRNGHIISKNAKNTQAVGEMFLVICGIDSCRQLGHLTEITSGSLNFGSLSKILDSGLSEIMELATITDAPIIIDPLIVPIKIASGIFILIPIFIFSLNLTVEVSGGDQPSRSTDWLSF